MYPGPLWDQVTAQKYLHPSVPVIAVMNPSNGFRSDPGYLPYVAKFKAASVLVLGYVATGYGTRTLASVAAECSLYESYYHTDGIFFDEYQSGWMPPSLLASPIQIGNPGTAATGPIPLITYENAGIPPVGTDNYIAHSVPVLPAVFPRPDWIYITDDRATYQVLPSYFAAEMAALDTGAAPPSSGGKLTLTTPDGKSYSWSV